MSDSSAAVDGPGYVEPGEGTPPPGHPAAAAGASEADQSWNRWVSLYALAASAIYAFGSLLSWSTIDGETVDGWKRADGSFGDGPFVVGIAVVGIVFAAMLLSGRSGPVVRAGLIVVGCFAAGVAVLQFIDILNDSGDVEPAYGLLVLVTSGASILVAGILMRQHSSS